jgi:hypothetical protein
MLGSSPSGGLLGFADASAPGPSVLNVLSKILALATA